VDKVKRFTIIHSSDIIKWLQMSVRSLLEPLFNLGPHFHEMPSHVAETAILHDIY